MVYLFPCGRDKQIHIHSHVLVIPNGRVPTSKKSVTVASRIKINSDYTWRIETMVLPELSPELS